MDEAIVKVTDNSGVERSIHVEPEWRFSIRPHPGGRRTIVKATIKGPTNSYTILKDVDENHIEVIIPHDAMFAARFAAAYWNIMNRDFDGFYAAEQL